MNKLNKNSVYIFIIIGCFVILCIGFIVGSDFGEERSSQYYKFIKMPAEITKLNVQNSEEKTAIAYQYIACYWAYTCTEYLDICHEEEITDELILKAKNNLVVIQLLL